MRRESLLILLFALIPKILPAQNGYVKLKDNDSTLVGFVRTYIAANGLQGVEVWRTKKDKDPLKIPKPEIHEYAIKKDTFRVLHQFKPFLHTRTFFEYVDARVLSNGKIKLLIIDNYQNAARISTYTGGGLVPAIIDEAMGNYTYMYVLENKDGYSALSSRKTELKETLLDYFPDKYIEKYIEVNGQIAYKSITDLVTLFNSK
jgi:hypothetical protein